MIDFANKKKTAIKICTSKSLSNFWGAYHFSVFFCLLFQGILFIAKSFADTKRTKRLAKPQVRSAALKINE